MKEVAIVSGVWTPIGAYCGMFRDVPVEKLAAIVLREAVRKANVKPDEIDDVILGHSFANGETPNLARLALLEAGWPVEIPGFTLDRRCCSGLQSIWTAAMQIQTGYADIVVEMIRRDCPIRARHDLRRRAGNLRHCGEEIEGRGERERRARGDRYQAGLREMVQVWS